MKIMKNEENEELDLLEKRINERARALIAKARELGRARGVDERTISKYIRVEAFRAYVDAAREINEEDMATHASEAKEEE